eukprot:CCRYP_020597-RA/>CCRYP_020597-RA protein AED:0.31 eAED:0.53 QI:0/0/0/1/0/0/2/0/76
MTTEANSNFKALCDSYGIMTNIDMVPSVEPRNKDTFGMNAAWAIRSTYHSSTKSLPRCSHFWSEHIVRHPLPGCLE